MVASRTHVGYDKQSGFMSTLLFFLLGVLVFFTATTWAEKVAANPHAMEHGDLAINAAKCLDGDGLTIGRVTNPLTGRDADICQDKDGKFYVLISLAGGVITAFCKDKMRRLDQVRKYLANRGYSEGQNVDS